MKTNLTEKQKNGITLISLVITIIVLLILATVAISLAVNSDGLFQKAGQAANEWNQSVRSEETDLNNLLGKGESIWGATISAIIPEGWDSNKIVSVANEGNRTAPIPQGYIASQVTGENTISNGLVIYEGTEPVNDTNHEEALTTRNQYVWIPVDDINQMIMCKSNTRSSICNIELQPDNTLKCTTHNSTDLAGRLYGVNPTTTDTEKPKIYTTNMNFSDRSQTYAVNSGYREPDLVTDYDKDSNTNYLATAGVTTAQELLTNLTQDFKEMATSIAKYKGFYISRYEAGENGASKKNQKVLTAITSSSTNYIGANMWYGLYHTLRNTTGNIVKTHMIWRKPVRPSHQLYRSRSTNRTYRSPISNPKQNWNQ